MACFQDWGSLKYHNLKHYSLKHHNYKKINHFLSTRFVLTEKLTPMQIFLFFTWPQSETHPAVDGSSESGNEKVLYGGDCFDKDALSCLLRFFGTFNPYARNQLSFFGANSWFPYYRRITVHKHQKHSRRVSNSWTRGRVLCSSILHDTVILAR